jgi:hypothetical protein
MTGFAFAGGWQWEIKGLCQLKYSSQDIKQMFTSHAQATTPQLL